MKIEIETGKIDHEEIIKMILPIILENPDAIKDKTLSSIVNMASVMKISGDTVAKMISLIPQDVKDSIVVYFINNHKDIVLNFMENMMDKNGIKIDLKDIEIKSV